jgi:sec-independent protein translocase protein TatA
VVILLFGGKKIPEMMKGLGTGINEFKKAARDGEQTPPASKKDDSETH